MTSVQVIHIKKDYEPILAFLYPEYSILDDNDRPSSYFIAHKDMETRVELDAYQTKCSHGIFISNKLFDEDWTKDVIKDKCRAFVKAHKVHRKTKFTENSTTKNDTFVQDCIAYIMGVDSEDEDIGVSDLFNSFGTPRFANEFIMACDVRGVQPIIKACTTFIRKIHPDSSSTYYKRIANRWYNVIQHNKDNAFGAYVNRPYDPTGLSFVKLIFDLTQK